MWVVCVGWGGGGVGLLWCWMPLNSLECVWKGVLGSQGRLLGEGAEGGRCLGVCQPSSSVMAALCIGWPCLLALCPRPLCPSSGHAPTYLFLTLPPPHPHMQVFGLPRPLVVEAQAAPDPEFPTVSFPNPEEGKGTWQMAFDTGGGAQLLTCRGRGTGGVCAGMGHLFLCCSCACPASDSHVLWLEEMCDRTPAYVAAADVCMVNLAPAPASPSAWAQPLLPLAAAPVLSATAAGTRLVLANDPDADRLAAAEQRPGAPGSFQTFSGNDIGLLLADWVWTNTRRRHPEVGTGGVQEEGGRGAGGATCFQQGQVAAQGGQGLAHMGGWWRTNLQQPPGVPAGQC